MTSRAESIYQADLLGSIEKGSPLTKISLPLMQPNPSFVSGKNVIFEDQ